MWVCRAVMTLPYMTIKALGLTLIHEMRGQVTTIDLYNGDGAHLRNEQDKVNDLENFIKQYGEQKVTTPEQLTVLVDKFIGGPERTISKTDQADGKATNDKATATATDAKTEAEGEAQTDILNDDDGIEVHLPEEAKKIVPSKPLSRLFPPVGEINVIAGQENSGKTSLIINEVVNVTKNAEAVGAKNGVNVLVMSYDLRYEFLSQYLLAYQCGPNRVIVVDRPKSWECIEEKIEKYSINALVLDSMLDFFSTYKGLADLKNDTNKRFDDINRRIDETNQSINKRIDDVNKRIDDVNRQFKTINNRIEALNNRFDERLDNFNRTLNVTLGSMFPQVAGKDLKETGTK